MKLATRMATGVGAALAVAGLIGGAGLADAALTAKHHTMSAKVSGEQVTFTVKNTASSPQHCYAQAIAGDFGAEMDRFYQWVSTHGIEQPIPADVQAAADRILAAPKTTSQEPLVVPAGQTDTIVLATPGTGVNTFTVATTCKTNPADLKQNDTTSFVITRSSGGGNPGGDSGSLGGGLGSLSGLF